MRCFYCSWVNEYIIHYVGKYATYVETKILFSNKCKVGSRKFCVDIRPLWGLFGPYKETNVRVLSLWGPLRGTNLCVKAKSIPGTPRIIYIPLLK